MPEDTARRPVLIGEAPSKQGDRYHMLPLSGRPAEVLCSCAGIPPEPGGSRYGKWTWALYERFECHNLFRRYADATPWRVGAARQRAREIMEEAAPVVAVFLGRKVAEAFGLGQGFLWGEWQEGPLVYGLPIAHAVMVPHPSGLSRIMNEQSTRDLVGRTLNEAIERMKASAATA